MTQDGKLLGPLEFGGHRPGAERLTLRVYRDNVAAVTLYRDLGFQPMEDASTPELLFMQRSGV
jgi:RimJ/RimL family protein N-acetyltransferase